MVNFSVIYRESMTGSPMTIHRMPRTSEEPISPVIERNDLTPTTVTVTVVGERYKMKAEDLVVGKRYIFDDGETLRYIGCSGRLEFKRPAVDGKWVGTLAVDRKMPPRDLHDNYGWATYSTFENRKAVPVLQPGRRFGYLYLHFSEDKRRRDVSNPERIFGEA